MANVRSKGVHVVRAATVHPDGAIPVDLAVHKEGVRRVLRQYGPTSFFPMSDDDPVVLVQSGEIMEDKQVAAYEDILERYSYYLGEDCRLLGPMAKVWVVERLAGIENQLAVLHPNHLEVRKSAQVDFAVEPSSISRVHRLCELVEFKRLSEDDSIIQMQLDGDPHMRIFNGYNHILRRYTEARVLRQVDGALKLYHIGRLGYV
ncbi:hypothetical protein BDW71DRAFT_214149 [Aspergillus fruticulosus]